jgi:platelet-activating factor acetylhydrolase
MVFSHGIAGNRTMYSTICGEMASYGMVVCAIEHRDHSGSYSYTTSDPKEVKYVFMPKDQTVEGFRVPQLKVRVEEVELAWEFIKELNEGKFPEDTVVLNEKSPDYVPNSTLEPFKNQLDLDNPIITGHSFGGATVLEYLTKNEVNHPYKCAVVFDPWAEIITLNPIKTPILSINTEGFTKWEENFKLVKEQMKSSTQLNSQVHLATINHITHLYQSDIPSLTAGFMKYFRKTSHLPATRATEMNNGLAISFIKEVYKGLGHFNHIDDIPSWGEIKSEKLWNEDLYFHTY